MFSFSHALMMIGVKFVGWVCFESFECLCNVSFNSLEFSIDVSCFLVNALYGRMESTFNVALIVFCRLIVSLFLNRLDTLEKNYTICLILKSEKVNSTKCRLVYI